MKRRNINMANQAKITQSFTVCKNTNKNLSTHLSSQKTALPKDDLKDQPRGLNLHYNGAHTSSTPFRSVNRVNQLLRPTTSYALQGQSKLVEIPQNILENLKQKQEDFSKPSSVATAFTQATTVYDYQTDSFKGSKKRDKKYNKKGLVQNGKFKQNVGSKRQAQLQLDQMEYFTRFVSSKNLPYEELCEMINLKQKKTGIAFSYPLYCQDSVYGSKNQQILRDFEGRQKLEVEFDYDTDCEQIRHSRHMLLDDLQQAIDFYVKEDPIKLIENVLI